jgi:hypothetical protein
MNALKVAALALIAAGDAAKPVVPLASKILALLPQAAQLYREKIDNGLDGNPVAAGKARTLIRELIGGKIDLVPEADGSLWAAYGLQKMALLQALI